MKSNDKSNSKRLARNTAFMYVRMILLTLITLFTSRIILQQLGVEDFGIYNVVGSIVLMFNSLKSTFAQSTQRFMSYEMGRGDYNKLLLIYNLSTLINIIIAVILVLLVEIVGLWFIEFRINFDSSRLTAAHWVFQFSVLTMIIGILTNPFNSAIIAHERMDFYAYLSIFEAIMKLCICYMLIYSPFDKLIYYGLLVFLVQLLVYLINLAFCKRQFSECRLSRVWDKEYFISMTKFSGWSFFGNTSYALTQSGMNLVLNIFGGPIVNAARGIANQVTSALNGFINNIVVVIRPFTVKAYASGQVDKTMKLISMSSKLYFVIQLCILIFFTFLASYIVQLWLGQQPEYAVLFIILVLIHSTIKSLHAPLDTLFMADGNIRNYQMFEGMVLALPIPFSYVLLKIGLPYYVAFLTIIACEVLHVAGVALLAKRNCHLQLKPYLKTVILPCSLCFFIYGIGAYVSSFISESFVYASIASVFFAIVTLLTMYFVGLDNYEKQQIFSIIRKKL